MRPLSPARVALGTLVLGAYGALMGLVLGFRVDLLVEPRWLGLVFGGSALLTLPAWLRRDPAWAGAARRHLMVTGFLTTFLAFLASPPGPGPHDWAAAFLPVFYAVLGTLVLEALVPDQDPPVPGAPAAGFEDRRRPVESLDLSRREREVAQALLGPGGHKEIGAQLFISENTVKKHARVVYHRAGVRTRSEFLRAFRPSDPSSGPAVPSGPPA